MSITIDSMIDAPRRRTAPQPPNRRFQNPSRLIPHWNLALGYRLIPRWTRLLVAKAIKPDYALGAHVAALGLAAAQNTALPSPFGNGMFVGEHGSWNRKPPSGYKVVFVPFLNGKPSGMPIDVLTGFLGPQGEAYGRPVGVAIDKRGALLVADDVGNVIWRATAKN